MEIREIIFGYGHKNIQATHKSTLEITKENLLSRKGDCIIAVSADKSVADLSPEFKDKLHNENSKITILIKAGKTVEVVNAFGSPRLILTHPKDVVVRKGSYVCSRTLAIRADKAACNVSRKLIEKLRNPRQKVRITLIVEV